MAHIYNEPVDFKNDMVDGFLAAYSRYVERVPGASAVMRRGGPREGKVSVVIGGGSGHYPAFCGTVGPGFADGAVIGDIFTSPSAEQAYRAGKALDGGAGVLFSFGNYAGDVMNFGAAQERLRAEGIDCRTVLVTDDVASASLEQREKRRGVVGDFVVFKIAGAAADRGDPLDRVEALARRANDATVSFGVAFAGCTFPGRTEPLFTVAPGQMDIGLGIHGEPGIRSTERVPASELAALLLDQLLLERPPVIAGRRTRAAVILNGLGATKYEELFVLWQTLGPLLDRHGIDPVLPETGEIVTSLDMAGCSLTLTWLDDELEELWIAPADTPAFRRGSVADLPQFAAAAHSAADTAGVAVVQAGSAASQDAARAARTAISAVLSTVSAAEEELGRIDSVAGDGDHGVGMVRGLRAAGDAAAATSPEAGVDTVLRAAGDAWADKAGGTSGVLWGAILTAVGAELGDVARPTAPVLARAVSAGAGALARMGRCQIGDKTMYDTLKPFADTFERSVADGQDLRTGWRAAVEVAENAARDTAALTPRLGRARPLAERSIGTPDAGATSMAMILRTVGEALDPSGAPRP